MEDTNYGSRAKKSLGTLGGPGSDMPSKIDTEADTDSLSGLISLEDAKAARAESNLKERINEVANLPDTFAGGYDTLNEDASDQQE